MKKLFIILILFIGMLNVNALENEYFNKYVGKKVTFIKEVYKDNYLIGHTGNYLLVKCYSKEDVCGEITTKITKVEYPYCIGDLTK